MNFIMSQTVVVGYLVPECMFDLLIKAYFVVSDRHDRELKERDLVWQDQVVTCPTLRQRDTFV